MVTEEENTTHFQSFVFILHTNHSFPSFLPSHLFPPPPFYPLLSFHFNVLRPPMGINKALHIKLRQDQALPPEQDIPT